MKKQIVGPLGAVVLAAVAVQYFPSTPAVTVCGARVEVDSGWRQHAEFIMTQPEDIHGSVVQYSFHALGGDNADLLPTLGGRASLAFMSELDYSQLMAQTAPDAASSAFDVAEKNRAVRHLTLIPANEEITGRLRGIMLRPGAHFHLSGRYLIFQDKTKTNNIPGTEYFLVQSLNHV